jgi:hypothetical protein
VRNLIFLLAAGLASAQSGSVADTTFEGRPAILLSNSNLELTVTLQGATLSRLVLKDDLEHLSPLWDPLQYPPAASGRGTGGAAPDGGAPGRGTQVGRGGGNGVNGHFVAVDGFGQPSAEDRAAGLPQHGEAHLTPMDVKQGREGQVAFVTLTGKLPIVQEQFTRTFRMVDGENVIYVDSQLDNLLGFDRPVNWAEHATLGSPFLEPGAVLVDFSASRSHTRNVPITNNGGRGGADRRLRPDQDFTWPDAPGLDGSTVNLRSVPDNPHFTDHSATLMDLSKPLAWATAINIKKNLIVGWIFRTADYFWIQNWNSFPSSGRLARGLEFSTQPYDVPRREVLSAPPLFGAPMYRWLTAKGKLDSRFLVFYAHAPPDFTKVDEIRVENGLIVLEDKNAGKRIRLSASRGL